MLSNPNDSGLVGNEKICLKNFNDLARAEEGFLKQKSRIQWLKLGDQNTNFFHKAVKARNSRNSIKFITMENGCRIDDPATIRQKFVEHFQSVLGSSMQDTADVEFNTDGLVWSSEHLDILNSRITHEEIKKSMFSIDDAKAPGPDGFSSLFFKRAWSIVGSEVCDAVADFFSSGCLLREIICTIIALVPKVPNPSSMHDYRPISCCNTIYKCISKIIAARIKRCLPDIISPAQAAFVQGRSIADNILLTQELMKNYHLDSGPPRCALKIDLKKAYDSIRWGCILDILSAMGTPATLLRCIKACITTPKFSICVNGELAGFFASKRGVRQGDPLSSFLFLIAMEAFSRSLSKAVLHPSYDFHPRCKQIKLLHLCFADDLFLFAKGNMDSVQIMLDDLAKFEAFFGMQVNKEKSAVFLTGIHDSVKATILERTGFSLGNLPMKYLGVPLISSKLSHSDCQPLLERTMARIQSWTSSSLSFAGRLQLISSVLYSIQTYWCTMVIIPKFTCSKIEQIFSGFLWSGKDVNARRAKVGWKSLCMPKEEGGLGLRRIKDLNDATIMKHIWNLFYRNDSIWVAWVREVLLRRSSIWIARTPSRCSWSWRKILQLRDRVRPFIRHQVCNGVKTFLWHDFWNHLGPIFPLFGERILYDSAIPKNARVSEVIDGTRWNWPFPVSADLIALKNSCAGYLLDINREDIISWTQSTSGVFTVSSACNSIRPRKPPVQWHAAVWFSQSIKRHSFIAWLVIQDRLSTQDKLLRWGLISSMACVYCQANEENRNHLFFECQVTSGIWMRVLRMCGQYRLPRRWENELLWVISCKGNSLCSITKRIAWGASIYHLWRQRNARVHENQYISVDSIFYLICNDVRLRITSFQNVADSLANRDLYERWCLPHTIFRTTRGD